MTEILILVSFDRNDDLDAFSQDHVPLIRSPLTRIYACLGKRRRAAWYGCQVT